ncbi:MAG: PKD domain-containing protein [Chitinophagaceae bacterium]
MNSFSIQKLILFIIFFATVSACTKTETITVQEPKACFTVIVPDAFGGYQSVGSNSYIDSNFYFRNCSDSGANITYQWNFGDGITSTDKNPTHSYPKRGRYSVTLTVSNNNRAYDTIRQTLSVILGQQHISFGDGISSSPVAIEETTTNEFVLLNSTGYGTNFFLIQLDSLLRQKSMKTFPANNRFTSMQATTDGNYILTGSTQSADKANELVKMKADGTQLWSKTISASDSYTYAAQTPDGGYAVIGSTPVAGPFGNTNYITTIIKTDNNANLQWQKLLDQDGMIQTKDAVIEQDGIVVAGVKRNINGACQDCDSLLIVKLNNSGNTVWKNTVLWGLNTSNWWNTRIIKLTNGNYAVNNEYTSGIFFFSNSGNFLDRKLAPHQVASIANSGDGNLIVLQSEPGNGNRISIAKLTLDGAQQWYAYPEGRQKMPGGYSCCSSSWPVAIRSLRNGGTITTGYRVNNNSTGSGIYTATVLLELDEAGKPK